MNLKDHIIEIPNYPQAGVNFKDITGILKNQETYQYTINQLTTYAQSMSADVVIGPEARGFFFGCPVAYNLKVGYVPVRKSGKLPRPVLSEKYQLEYGTDTLEIHQGDLKPGQRILIIDDVLATGGTTETIIKLVEKSEAIIAGIIFVIELKDLGGYQKLAKYPVKTLITY